MIVYALVALGQIVDGAEMPGVGAVEVAVVEVLPVNGLELQALLTVQDTVYVPDDGAVTLTVEPVVELVMLPLLTDQLYVVAPAELTVYILEELGHTDDGPDTVAEAIVGQGQYMGCQSPLAQMSRQLLV